MDTVEELRQLIAFPSVSRESNVDITEHIQQRLQALEFQTERVDYDDECGTPKSCVVARKGPAGSGLAFFAHSDVVAVDSWQHPRSGPWEATVHDGRVYGRGACDMKGSLACMLSAVSTATDKLKAPVFLTVTADEEVGYGGARHVVEQSKFYREMVTSNTRAIVGEPTGLQVVHAHKGGRAMRVVATGRAAHSSTGLGVNANEKLIPFLSQLLELHQTMENSSEWRDERFTPPTPTMNIGINDRNGAVNITSPRSECTLYFRPMPEQDADSIVDRISNMARQLGLDSSIKFSGDPLFTDPESPFIRELVDITGHPSRTVAYGTDGAVFTELSRIAVLGPGDIAQAHTDDEWIALEQLQACTELFAQLIRTWCH
jgi:acetylornithine deacetylase